MVDTRQTAFEIGDLHIQPGRKVQGVLGTVQMPTGENLQVHSFVARGLEDGPTLVVTAATHGSEIVGTGAAIMFARALDPVQLRGTVIVVPISNPPAVAAGTYTSPFDGVNMSGPIYWDGPYGRNASHQLAGVISKALERTDYYIDLHGNFEPCAPMAMMFLEQAKDQATRAATLQLGDAFGLTPVDMSEPPAHPAWLGPMGAFPAPTALAHGIPALMVELQGAPTLLDAERGCTGLFNVLRSLKMIDDGVALVTDPAKLPGRYRYYGALETQSAGLMWVRHPAGQLFKAGALLAEITDTFGDVIEEIHSPVDGFCWAYFGSHHGTGTHAVFGGATAALIAQRVE